MIYDRPIKMKIKKSSKQSVRRVIQRKYITKKKKKHWIIFFRNIFSIFVVFVRYFIRDNNCSLKSYYLLQIYVWFFHGSPNNENKQLENQWRIIWYLYKCHFLIFLMDRWKRYILTTRLRKWTFYRLRIFADVLRSCNVPKREKTSPFAWRSFHSCPCG